MCVCVCVCVYVCVREGERQRLNRVYIFLFRLVVATVCKVSASSNKGSVIKHTSLTMDSDYNNKKQCFRVTTSALSPKVGFKRMVKIHQYPIQVYHYIFYNYELHVVLEQHIFTIVRNTFHLYHYFSERSLAYI